jgi:hypothetical protein
MECVATSLGVWERKVKRIGKKDIFLLSKTSRGALYVIWWDDRPAQRKCWSTLFPWHNCTTDASRPNVVICVSITTMTLCSPGSSHHHLRLVDEADIALIVFVVAQHLL